MPRLTALHDRRAYIFVVVASALFGWGLYAAVTALNPPETIRVRLASGPAVTRRFQIAEDIAAEGRKRDLIVELVPTEGFEDSIRQVAEGKLDLALVSSGLEIPECKAVREVAGLDIAPLHILVRRELAERNLSLQATIRGRRVNVGQHGTNDFLLATDVLRYLRLIPIDPSGDGDYTPQHFSVDELSKIAHCLRTQSGEVREATLRASPEVVATVASLPGKLVQELLDTGEYGMVPFHNVEPYLMSAPTYDISHAQAVNRDFVEPIVIHKGMYLGDSLLPSSDCPTVGLRTLLVTRADLSSEAVERIMQCVFETDFARRMKPRSPRDVAAAYGIHPGAEDYLDRDKPILTGRSVDMFSKGLSIFGAFSAGVLSLYGFLRRRRIRRPGEYLDEILAIDALLAGRNPEGDAVPAPSESADQLDARLAQLKERILQDYCNNRVQGEMVLLSVLSVLADSRTQLRTVEGRSHAALPPAPLQTPRLAA